ncbi:hypothetical protein INR49_000114, partial [Caranx melampygus]
SFPENLRPVSSSSSSSLTHSDTLDLQESFKGAISTPITITTAAPPAPPPLHLQDFFLLRHQATDVPSLPLQVSLYLHGNRRMKC